MMNQKAGRRSAELMKIIAENIMDHRESAYRSSTFSRCSSRISPATKVVR